MDVTLATTIIGAGPRLVLLHGFTQNARCWGPLASVLAERFEVVLVDAPGHGDSGHDDADLWAAADLIAEVGGRARYVGYSMGGRMALHLAVRHPDSIESLVLIGATAGLESPAERSARREADERLAERLDAAAAARSVGNDEPFRSFLVDWLANPLFSSLPESSRHFDARLANRPEGLAASLRQCGTGSQEPLWASLASIAAPVAVVAGSSDAKFTDLARRMAGLIGANAEVRVEPGSHAVHLEVDDAIARAVASLESRLD